jgi:hypothetical protein
MSHKKPMRTALDRLCVRMIPGRASLAAAIPPISTRLDKPDLPLIGHRLLDLRSRAL